MQKEVKCTFSTRRYKNLDLPPSLFNSVKVIGSYICLYLSGKLSYRSFCEVFCILQLSKNEMNFKNNINLS